MDDLVPEGLTNFHAITIIYSDEDEPPKVDLGNTNPWLAVAILGQVVDALEMTLVPPTIHFDGKVIFQALPED